MILSKNSIVAAVAKGDIVIEPFDEAMFKEASYSFTLPEDLMLAPGDFKIIQTREKLTLSSRVACILSTRRSVAEQGIDALQTDFFCEPGTNNRITLDVKNHGPTAVALNAGSPIVKGIFFEVG